MLGRIPSVVSVTSMASRSDVVVVVTAALLLGSVQQFAFSGLLDRPAGHWFSSGGAHGPERVQRRAGRHQVGLTSVA